MEVFWIAGGVAVCAWTIAQDEIFREIRDNICKPAIKNEQLPFVVRKAAYMPTCEYCCSFWVTLASCLVFHQQVQYDGWRGYLLGHLVTWALAIVYMSLYQLTRVGIKSERAEASKDEAITEKVKENGRPVRVP